MIVDVELIRFISPGVAVENGVANLTKDEAPALLHFADGQTQQRLLVRLKNRRLRSSPNSLTGAC